MSWPHAPAHTVVKGGTYIITGSTYQKVPFFNSPERLDLLESTLFQVVREFGWELEAWAFLQNHYHLIAVYPKDRSNLAKMINKFHAVTARQLNDWDQAPKRRVWYQYWETPLTFERSYLARLNYVHHNPVKHGLVLDAERYRWCSASWFKATHAPSFVKTVLTFKMDTIRIFDDF
jgi:putative transposase